MAFYTLAEEADLIDSLINTGRCEVDEIGQSVEGRPIRLLRIGDPPPAEDDRAALMLVGMQHGLEPAGRQAILQFAQAAVGPTLDVTATSGDYASTPDHADLDITGDLDIRADVALDNWQAGLVYLVSKYVTSTNQRSYGLRVDADGNINLIWSPDGSSFENHDSTASVLSRLPAGPTKRLAVRATLDVSNESGVYELKFWTAPCLDGTWTQLGDTITGAASTSIFNSTSDLIINGHSSGTSGLFAGSVYSVQVRDGIDGAVVASPRFQNQDPGDTSFADVAGRTWTVNGTAAIASPLTAGELSFLATWGVHLIPSVNPDGFVNGTRNNAADFNINRDWIRLGEPETRAVSAKIGELQPMVLIDHHEYVGTTARSDIEAARSYNPQAHANIGTHSGAIETAILSRATTEGWSNAAWGASNRGDLIVLDINSTLRHIASVIIETNRTGTPTEDDRTTMHAQSIEEILGYTVTNVATIESDIDTAISDVIAEGAAGTAPFDVRGGILDPPPLAYQLTGLVPNFHLEVFGITVDPGLIVSMAQRAQPLIPYLFDALSEETVTLGIRLFSLSTAATAATVEDFAAVVSGSHRMVVEARILSDFLTGLDPDGTEVAILGGDVQLDGTAEIRGTLSLEIPGVDESTGKPWFPRRAADLLAPYGVEVFVRRGVDLGSEILWAPLGYYRIDSAEQDGKSDDPIRITGSDRMAGILDARPIDVRELLPSRSVGSVFAELVGEVYPSAAVVFDDDSAAAAIGRPLVVEESRYEVLLEIATSLGKIMFWDGEGLLQVRDAPDESTPLWQVKAGHSGVLIGAGRRVSREGVYNAVVATGEAGDNDADPVRGIAVDSGATSPTRWGGRFGRVPRFYSSPFIRTQSQAEKAAREMLRRSLGAPRNVAFQAIVNPALAPWDPVRITHDDGNREIHVMERVTIPLAADGAMSGSTREKTLVVIGSSV